MKLIITGRNIEVTEPIRVHAEEKLEKFDKYFQSDIEAHVTFSVQKRNQTVEITIHLKEGTFFRVEESTNDMYASIDLAIDKLAKQMKKHKTKIEKRFHGRGVVNYDEVFTEEPVEEEMKIVKTKKFGIKPMMAEEAVLQMEMLGHDFFVFLNGETDEVNVVYKRKNDDFGLIEPYLY